MREYYVLGMAEPMIHNQIIAWSRNKRNYENDSLRLNVSDKL